MSIERQNPVPRKITGSSYQEIREKLDAEYGPKCYSIQNFTTELVSPKLWGLIPQKEKVTVTYVLDQITEKKLDVRTPSKTVDFSENENYNPRKVSSAVTQSEGSDSFESNRNAILKSIGGGMDPQTMIQLSKLTSTVANLSNEVHMIRQQESENIIKIEQLLEENEFTNSFVRQIKNRIYDSLTPSQIEDWDYLQTQVLDWIIEGLSFARVDESDEQQAIIVVGPTGIGKTTTIAKLGALSKLISRKYDEVGKKQVFISIDNMRVGAFKQLEDWANAMDIPVRKTASQTDLMQEIKLFKQQGFDYIFVDTSGFSPNDFTNLGKMRTVLNVSKIKTHVFLALSAASKASDLETILSSFEQFNYESIILTKFDETMRLGNVISVLSQKNKPISWISDGQNVPTNIQRASLRKILMGINGFNVDLEHIQDRFGIDVSEPVPEIERNREFTDRQ